MPNVFRGGNLGGTPILKHVPINGVDEVVAEMRVSFDDDRRRFRERRNRLKSGFDYAFVPEEQTWYPVEFDRYGACIAGKSES